MRILGIASSLLLLAMIFGPLRQRFAKYSQGSTRAKPDRRTGGLLAGFELDLVATRGTFSRVQRAFAGLSGGDRVIVLYQPGEGVSMRVNGSLVAQAKSHGVVDAILEAWKERDTIAERLERLASDHSCK